MNPFDRPTTRCPSCLGSPVGAKCGALTRTGTICRAHPTANHNHCRPHLDAACAAVEDDKAARREANRHEQAELGRVLTQIASGLPLHIWEEHPLLHVLTGFGCWHLAPTAGNGRDAYPIPVQQSDWTGYETKAGLAGIAELTKRINELANLGAMTDCDLSEYPADKLALPMWSPRTLCGQRWTRIATASDKTRALIELQQTRPHLETSLCGRCSA